MTSEKANELRLVSGVNDIGGWAIKLSPQWVKGMPDRLVLMPGGRLWFVELKQPGGRVSKAQKWVHRRLKALGFEVLVLWETATIKQFLEDIDQ